MALFAAGGFPMVIVLVLGLAAIGAAGWLAARPSAAAEARVAALCRAVQLASVAGAAMDLWVVSQAVPANAEWTTSENFPIILLVGFGEAVTPIVLGFALATLAQLVAAVGARSVPAAA